MKAGVTTSELFLGAGTIGSLLTWAADAPLPSQIVAASVVGVYIICRTALKIAEIRKP